MAGASFSLDELRTSNTVDQGNLNVISASDSVILAYRRYAPGLPRAIVLFYHGGGAYSGAGYQFLGNGLCLEFDTAVYLPDIRGHGGSGGPRGDAPSPEQVWDDITTFIKMIRVEYPHIPLFIGGHSSGAGQVLNYVSQPNHEPVDGYLFLSPQLGPQAQIDRPNLAAPFARVDSSAYAAYFMSGGKEHGHDHAVKFNYPAESLVADPGLVASITIIMSLALTPSSPRQQFASLNCPFGLWIGTEDELFLPDKVLAYGDLVAKPFRERSEVMSIPNVKHLSILVNAQEIIGRWISSRTSVQ
jgi:acylglycerol lipase